jgi:hypothetical protein
MQNAVVEILDRAFFVALQVLDKRSKQEAMAPGRNQKEIVREWFQRASSQDPTRWSLLHAYEAATPSRVVTQFFHCELVAGMLQSMFFYKPFGANFNVSQIIQTVVPKLQIEEETTGDMAIQDALRVEDQLLAVLHIEVRNLLKFMFVV